MSFTIHFESKGGTIATKTLTTIIHKEEEFYVAECPEVGTVSQGENIEEAIANLKKATELYLEEFPLPEYSFPLMASLQGELCLDWLEFQVKR
jgi:predicted RNase H-like HicB family nuclease